MASSESHFTLYIFHGDDGLAVDEAVATLRANMGEDLNADLNTSEFDGTVTSPAEALNAVTSMPFLSDKRLVFVRGMLSWLTRKGAGQTGKDGVQRLKDELPTLPDHARLVFVERETLSDKHPIIKLAHSLDHGMVKAFHSPKDSTGWILNRTRTVYEREINNRAAAALAAVTGDDLRLADNELVKLIHYVEPPEIITEMDVAALTPYVPEANIFKMVDAIAEGRGQTALQLLHRLMADKKQDPFSLFGMIVRQFRLLLLAKEHLASGGSSSGLAKAIGVRPFVAQNLTQQARRFSLEDLEHIYRVLQDSDLKMKTGRIQPELALDLFIAGVAQ